MQKPEEPSKDSSGFLILFFVVYIARHREHTISEFLDV